MRIRSKLLVLIAIPILAISLAAGFGFRAQSSAIETAEDSLDAVTESQTVHDAVLAIGRERLQRFGADVGDQTEIEAATDAATTTAVDSSASESMSGATATVSQLVAEARQADDSVAIGLYTEANRVLLTASIDDAANYPNAVARNDAIVNRLAVEALEARETAWFQYLTVQRANGAAPNVDATQLATAFTDGRANFRQATIISGGTSTADINSALQSTAAQRIASLETVAIDDLGENTISVTDDDALDALVAFRSDWTVTIDAQAASLRNVVDRELTGANDLRSLFTLLAIVGAIVATGLIFVIYRSITTPLTSLLHRAGQVAHEDLPNLVTTLRNSDGSGELPTADPIPITSNDEIGDLVAAFNDVQTTAYDLATEQALGRRAIGDMFVNLGRRNQQLLQRILRRLTELQRDEEDPETLESLFELDNIVTRMRRNAESLLVMAGATTPRQWTKAVDVENAVRAAFGEVEGYQRIDVSDLDGVQLRGDVVADVAHLLAELLENAINFSEAESRVVVGGRTNGTGYTLSVVDEGIGMTPDELEDNNRRISDPPPLDQIPTKFLGLFVVGRLAERHGITVHLNQAPGRGVNARVELPKTLLAGQVNEDPPVRTKAEDSSPLIEDHDLDAELAELTASSESDHDELDINELDNDDLDFEDSDLDDSDLDELSLEDEPADEPDAVGDDSAGTLLPTREVKSNGTRPKRLKESPAVGSSDQESGHDRRSDDDEPQELVSETPAETPASEATISGLPVRNAGQTLSAAPAAAIERPEPKERAATDASEDSAGNFSSMMSALSTGISRGLQDSDETPDAGNEN